MNKGLTKKHFDVSRYARAIDDYFKLKDAFREVADQKDKIQLIPSLIPTMGRFAIENNISRRTLLRWYDEKGEDGKKRYPEYCEAYEQAKECQRIYMIEAGVVGALNPGFSTLLMKNAHNWKDKIESKVDMTLENFNEPRVDDRMENQNEKLAKEDEDIADRKKILGVK